MDLPITGPRRKLLNPAKKEAKTRYHRCSLIEWMYSVIGRAEIQWDGRKYKMYFHFPRPLYLCAGMLFLKGVIKVCTTVLHKSAKSRLYGDVLPTVSGKPSVFLCQECTDVLKPCSIQS